MNKKNMDMFLGVSNSWNEGTQPEFPFPNSGDPSSTPTDSKKNKPFISFKPF